MSDKQSKSGQISNGLKPELSVDKLHTAVLYFLSSSYTVWSVSAMSTSSSSSEDEDLAKFASVAVSAEQIHIQSREDAQKRAAQATRAPISSRARPAAVSAAAAAVAGTPKHDDEAVTGLDIVSVKVRHAQFCFT